MNRIALPSLLALLFASGQASGLSRIDNACQSDLVWPFHRATVSPDVHPQVILCGDVGLQRRTERSIQAAVTFTRDDGTSVPFSVVISTAPHEQLEIIPETALDAGTYTLRALEDRQLSGCNKPGRGPSEHTFSVADTPELLEATTDDGTLRLLFSEPMEPESVVVDAQVEGEWIAIDAVELPSLGTDVECDGCGTRVLRTDAAQQIDRVRVSQGTSARGGELAPTEMDLCSGDCDELAWRSRVAQ